MTDLTIHTRVVRLPDLIASDMDGDLVMMSIARGEYYGISGVGTRVWELLDQPRSIADLVSVIEGEFEVDAATCQQDITRFVDELLSRNLAAIA